MVVAKKRSPSDRISKFYKTIKGEMKGILKIMEAVSIVFGRRFLAFWERLGRNTVDYDGVVLMGYTLMSSVPRITILK